MTMHKALYPRDDVDGLYVSRKKGGRGLASIEDSIDTSIQLFEDYIVSRDIPLGGGRLILSSRFDLIVSSRQKSDR